MTPVKRHAALGLVLAALVPWAAALGCPGPEPQLAVGGSGGTGGSGGHGGTGGTGGLGGSGAAGGGCNCPEVDVLFVVDNTDSIDPYVDTLSATLQAGPFLVEAIKGACTYHLGVVNPTPQVNNPDTCRQLGALSRVEWDGDPCPMDNGRYVTEADHDNLLAIFGCLMIVGTDGDGNERPVEAIFEAIGDEINGPGGCNEGFFRPNAPLVTVIISDVDDQSSFDGQLNPSEWYDNLLAIKGGNRDLLASVALLVPNAPSEGECPGETDPADNLRDFVQAHKVDRQAILNMCDPTSVNIQDAVAQIFDAVCPAPNG